MASFLVVFPGKIGHSFVGEIEWPKTMTASTFAF
jgi:hypothetical protein